MAYEGMIFREVVERLKETDTKGIKWSMLHFAGFNALNNCEKTDEEIKGGGEGKILLGL